MQDQVGHAWHKASGLGLKEIVVEVAWSVVGGFVGGFLSGVAAAIVLVWVLARDEF